MQFTFIDMTGQTLFIRDDAETARWTEEELTLDIEFPRVEDKVITTGQRIVFSDPSTGLPQVYEVKQAKTLEPDHYQSIVAENICVSELTDEHINSVTLSNKTASDALSTVLSGTLWSIGTVGINPVSSVEISRGSVWQAVLEIKSNFNVYIEPRVAFSGGTITRVLDIIPTSGTWNGLRLSVDKNLTSPAVTIDDTNVFTAMYGYGGSTIPTAQGETEKEINFADVVWSKTDAHPAKPGGQTYIEDPAATAAYGRNGRARFGYYQNTSITDPEILLQKTWETLQTVMHPAISIDGTVADLYRMGYADEPIRLHDIALVEVLPAGYKEQIQIIRMTVDLLNPAETTVTIGAYIPNIVYLEKESFESITGTRGGGGRGGGNGSKQSQRSEYETAIEKNNRQIVLRAYQNDLDDVDNNVKKQEARITVEANRITQEVTDRRNADGELNGKITVEANRITQEVTQRQKGEETLSSRITVEAWRITQEVTDRRNADTALGSRITQTANNITLEVNRAKEAEGKLSGRISVNADNITAEVTRATTAEGTLSGRITTTADAITAEVTRAQNSENALSGRITVNADKVGLVVEEKDGQNVVKASSIVAGINDQSGSYVQISADKINLSGYVTASQLNATQADINKLKSGESQATLLKTGSIVVTSSISFGGNYLAKRTYTINGTEYRLVTW